MCLYHLILWTYTRTNKDYKDINACKLIRTYTAILLNIVLTSTVTHIPPIDLGHYSHYYGELVMVGSTFNSDLRHYYGELVVVSSTFNSDLRHYYGESVVVSSIFNCDLGNYYGELVVVSSTFNSDLRHC